MDKNGKGCHAVGMNPSEIRTVLEQLGRGANKSLGQHFLIDRAALRAVVDAVHIQTGDRVVEIGPGLGVLTGELLQRGANVISIERDRGLAAWLRQRYAAEIERGQFTLIEADAADGDWLRVVGEGPWKFVSNLPYSITSLALRLALWAPNPPTKLSVLIQKEVADRIIDRDNTSLLSLMVGLAAQSSRIMRRVPPGAFYPPPKVDSAVLFVDVLAAVDRLAQWGIAPERVMSYAKKGFAHPRKMLMSNLQLAPQDRSLLEGQGFAPTIRAEALDVQAWVKLAKALETARGDVMSSNDER